MIDQYMAIQSLLKLNTSESAVAYNIHKRKSQGISKSQKISEILQMCDRLINFEANQNLSKGSRK